MMKKALPIGVDDFREIMTEDYYYVDKTMLIKDILDMKGKVDLFTRPRRFGKTLNLSSGISLKIQGMRKKMSRRRNFSKG